MIHLISEPVRATMGTALSVVLFLCVISGLMGFVIGRAYEQSSHDKE